MGSALTTIGLDPIPDTDDNVLIPADVAQYANAIDHKIVHWASDQNDRDVLYAAAAAPLFVMSPTTMWCKISGSGGGSVWVTLWGDTGEVTSGIVAGTDFEYSRGFVRKLDEKLVVFSVEMIRRNSDINLNTYNHATSPGNIVGDPTAFTLPVGFRPTLGDCWGGTWRSGTTNGAFRVSAAGAVGLFSGNPNTTIVQDDDVEMTGAFTI